MPPSDSDDKPTRSEAQGMGASDESDAERQRRLDTLRDLAAHSAPAPHPEVPTPAVQRASLAPPSRRLQVQRTRNRWLAGIAAALCVVVIAVVAITRLTPPRAHVSTTPRPTGPTVIHLTLDKMACAQDAAWSPDGTQVAVIGSNCDASDTLLNIYDAASGKLTAQTDLTAAATHALQTFFVLISPAHPLTFHAALWTRQQLFIPFECFELGSTEPANAIPDEGLLGFNADGASPLQPAIGIVPNRSGPGGYVRWDMFGFNSPDTKTFPAALVGPAPSHTIFSTLPPSLAYQMNHFDQPGAYTPLSYRAAPPSDPGGPIGNPTGDNQLTIWQPGTLTYLATVPGTATPANSVLFDTSFAAAESPFLFTNLTFEGRLVPPDQPAPDVNALGAAGMLAPWLPIRDSALAYVLTDVEHSAGPGVGPAAIAWRPDGARLAYQPGIAINGGGNPRAHDVRIYDCKTGQVLVTLTPPLPSGTPIRASNLLRWSPDGKTLLLLDRIASEIVVWGHGQLPA